MKRYVYAATIAIASLFNSLFVSAKAPETNASAALRYGSINAKAPLLFIPNKGQVNDAKGGLRNDILFTAASGPMKLFLSANGIAYQFTKPARNIVKGELADAAIETFRFDFELIGSNAHPVIRTENKAVFKENFYLSQCPQGITDVPAYGKLVYEDIYPGIDWVVYNKGGKMEYDFAVKSGADVSKIRMKIKDADAVYIAKDGSLVINTKLGEVRQHAPNSFVNGQKVASHFCRYHDGSIGFVVPTRNKDQALVIDPSVSWGTYYGGTGNEQFNSVVVSGGSVYLIGRTNSTSGIAYNGYNGVADTLSFGTAQMIVKFDTMGNRIWATYYGGNSTSNFGYGGVVDSAGNLYVAGLLQSQGLATAGAHQTTMQGIVDASLVKFTSNGTRIWATYFGGTGNDQGFSCAVYGDKLYLAGQTNSSVSVAYGSAFQDTIAAATSDDAFLAQFDTSGVLNWATYYGGTNPEGATSTAVDGSGNVYLGGFTESSTGISSVGSFQPVTGGYYDVFLAKFNSSGARQWGTYYGGTGNDLLATSNAIAVTGGNVYIAGQTTTTITANTGISPTPVHSTTYFVTPGRFQTTLGGGEDAFLAKFDTSGNRIWSTYYGGSGNDYSSGCALDGYGGVYLSGYTASASSIASSNAFQNTFGGDYDGFIVKFDSSGASRAWGSYYGGSDTDYVYGISPDGAGHVYIAGYSNSTSGIATAGSFQSANAGGYDGFVTKISDPIILVGAINPTVACTGIILAVPYTVVGSFAADNVFSVNLSAATGSFSSFTTIGTVTATGSGTIAATIPTGTTGGTAYRIVILGSDPFSGAGQLDTLNVSISSIPVIPSIIGNSSVCTGLSYTYRASGSAGATSYAWTLPSGWSGTSITDTIHVVSGTAGGNIKVVSSNVCGSSPAQILSVIVTPTVTPSVVITVHPGTSVFTGEAVTFSATVTNGGASPVLEWRDNNVAIAGATSLTYVTDSLHNGDVITLWIQADTCANPDTMVSNSIVMSVTLGVVNYLSANNALTVYPNPNNGSFSIAGDLLLSGDKLYIEVSNQIGQIVHKETIESNNQRTRQIDLAGNLKTGIYLLKVWNDKESKLIPIVINRDK